MALDGVTETVPYARRWTGKHHSEKRSILADDNLEIMSDNKRVAGVEGIGCG